MDELSSDRDALTARCEARLCRTPRHTAPSRFETRLGDCDRQRQHRHIVARTPHSTGLWVTLALATTLVACAGTAGSESKDTAKQEDTAAADVVVGAVDGASALPDVTAQGPYRVGYRLIKRSYTPETFTAERPLEMAVWYPTEVTQGNKASYRGLVERDNVLAEPAPAGTEAYPVLVFSHGNKSFSQQSWFLMERLASHGWLVVAPDHEGNTAFDFDKKRHDLMRLLRPLDIRASLDAMDDLAPDDPLYGRLGTRVALAGHSFGAFTTLLVGGATLSPAAWDATCSAGTTKSAPICAYWTDARRKLVMAGFIDKRFGALIPMAPSNKDLFATKPTAAVSVPTLMFTAALDGTSAPAEHADPLWAGFAGKQHLRADLPTGGHFTFSNACELGLGKDDGCGDGFIPTQAAHAIINTLTLSWLRLHLQGDQSVVPILSGAGLAPAEVTLSRHQ